MARTFAQATVKVDLERLSRLMREGKTTGELAKFFGVSNQAIHMAKRRLEKKLTVVPEVYKSELSRDNIDTVNQLRSMNDKILDEMERCQRLIMRQDEREREIEVLENETTAEQRTPEFLKKLRDLAAASVADILNIQRNIIAISGEVRQQIALQVKIWETVHNVQMVAEFQEEVLKVLKEIEPEKRDEIIKRLKYRRSLRGLTRMNP